jgi:triosephosphate isomerase (TIM)
MEFMMTRKKFLAGNWKMQKTRAEASEFFQSFTRILGNLSDVTRLVDIAFGVPATLFDASTKNTAGSGVKILAQNVHFEKQGAFTGELSTGMLADAGLGGSIIGHSERRQYFAENDEAVGKKWNALSLAGLLPVVCVGETKTEREQGKTNDVVTKQFESSLVQVSVEAKAKEFVVAYEPVWAIGTGLTATPEQAEDVHKMIRGLLEKHFGKERAASTRILYGGSMNASNCAELLQKPNIDGGLVGGASLKPEDFSKMLQAALAAK